ncbi:CDP-alcohol phosphatidyltransferase family protein [Floccifex sp.]|uniref:CDP-alcohol phosphatidyltransferase family protein n=1 Tax=Floccifex sp. TaxID=2815810 RepID=UPI003F0FA813
MLGFYNYTVILTYIGMISGFVGIASILQEKLILSLICLIISGICDMFDGKVASTMDRTIPEKQFGIEIDSLSDLICFGVLPATIVFVITRYSMIGLCISSFYVLCALIRLAWFNVDEIQRQQNETGRRECYLGLPVTTSSFIIPLFVFICKHFHFKIEWALPITLFMIAIAFLTPFKIKKPKISNIILLLLLSIIFVIALCKVIVWIL